MLTTIRTPVRGPLLGDWIGDNFSWQWAFQDVDGQWPAYSAAAQETLEIPTKREVYRKRVA